MDRADVQLSELDRVVARLISVLAADAPASDDLRAVEAELRRRLSSFEPRVDVEAVTQEALLRLMEVVASQEPVRHPAGLLLVIARRLALDQLRGAWVRRTEPLPRELLETPGDDDAIAALLSRDADARAVMDAMTAAARQGDDLGVRCVAVWLELAERHGAAPSSREVAALAGVSHTTVANALARFRSHLEQ